MRQAIDHNEARDMIRDYYSNISDTGDIVRLRGVVAFLGATLAEHMTWDAAIHLAEWIEQQDATTKRS